MFTCKHCESLLAFTENTSSSYDYYDCINCKTEASLTYYIDCFKGTLNVYMEYFYTDKFMIYLEHKSKKTQIYQRIKPSPVKLLNLPVIIPIDFKSFEATNNKIKTLLIFK